MTRRNDECRHCGGRREPNFTYCAACLLLCRKCWKPRDRPHHLYCSTCSRTYMKAYVRKKPRVVLTYAEMSESQREQIRCASLTRYYQKTGGVPTGPCEGCESTTNVQNHHHWGYDKPRWFVRLCKPCHQALHATFLDEVTQGR